MAEIVNFKKYMPKVLGYVSRNIKTSSVVETCVNSFLNLLLICIVADSIINSEEVEKTINHIMIGKIRELATYHGNLILKKYYNSPVEERTKCIERNLVIEPGKIMEFINNVYKLKVDIDSILYITIVLEYIMAELLEISSIRVSRKGKEIIEQVDLFESIKNDDELNKLAEKIKWIYREDCTYNQTIGSSIKQDSYYTRPINKKSKQRTSKTRRRSGIRNKKSKLRKRRK